MVHCHCDTDLSIRYAFGIKIIDLLSKSCFGTCGVVVVLELVAKDELSVSVLYCDILSYTVIYCPNNANCRPNQPTCNQALTTLSHFSGDGIGHNITYTYIDTQYTQNLFSEKDLIIII